MFSENVKDFKFYFISVLIIEKKIYIIILEVMTFFYNKFNSF